MAAMYCAMRIEACLVQCESSWTGAPLCRAILDELGVKPKNRIWEMSQQIQQTLSAENIPLMIDEADFMISKKYVELIRDFYEKSQVPVILIGEEQMPSKLRQWERINGRLLERVAAEPLDDADFDALLAARCPDLQLASDLEEAIKHASRGSARLIVNNLESVRMQALTHGLDGAVSLSDLGGFQLHDGIPPQIRRFA